MSIIIKSDQLNILLYKYLQECNLTHTAFTLYNEAHLEQSLLQYKFDIKSGQLVSLIEKALIFGQIEAHITINEYEECKEGFYLLRPHVCKITQKVREEKEALFNQLNQNVFAAMRRTSSVHNTLQPNKEFQEIIYEQRSANFFDKIPLRLADSNQLTLKVSRGQSITSEKFFCAYQAETTTMTIMTKKDNFLTTSAILPCKAPVTTFEIVDDILVIIYEGNQCEIIQLESDGFKNEIILFKIQFGNQCREIKSNKKIKNLICFQAQQEFVIINLNTKKQLAKGKGIFEWIDYFSYLVLLPAEKIVKRFSLKPDQKEKIQEFKCPLSYANKIRISCSQIYFSVESLAQNTVLVYNLDEAQPLYIFNFSQNDKQTDGQQNSQEESANEELKQIIWLTANSADNIILITDASIKTFQIELNNFSKIIEISAYDREVKNVQLMRKNQNQSYIICLGIDNLILYDASLGKIQRVQYSEEIHPYALLKLDEQQFVGVVAEDRICILQKSDIEPLFT